MSSVLNLWNTMDSKWCSTCKATGKVKMIGQYFPVIPPIRTLEWHIKWTVTKHVCLLFPASTWTMEIQSWVIVSGRLDPILFSRARSHCRLFLQVLDLNVRKASSLQGNVYEGGQPCVGNYQPRRSWESALFKLTDKILGSFQFSMPQDSGLTSPQAFISL